MTHVTSKLTAKNRDQLRNPALGTRVYGYLFLYLFIWTFTRRANGPIPSWRCVARYAVWFSIDLWPLRVVVAYRLYSSPRCRCPWRTPGYLHRVCKMNFFSPVVPSPSILCLQSALTLLVGHTKGIRPVKTWVVGCWRGYLTVTGARCRLAYGPVDASHGLTSREGFSILVWKTLAGIILVTNVFVFRCYTSQVNISFNSSQLC